VDGIIIVYSPLNAEQFKQMPKCRIIAVQAIGVYKIADEVKPYSVLLNMEEVTITPHVAYYSQDACDEVREKAIQQVIEVLWHQNIPAYKIN